MATTIELHPAFEANLRRRGRKQSTLDQYRKTLDPWLRHGGNREIDTLTPDDMATYLDWYESDFYERYNRAPSNNQRGNIISAVSVFFQWAHKYGHLDRDPTIRLRDEAPKREYRLTEWLRPDEDRAMLGACRTDVEYRVVYLLRFAGLRAQEAANLRWSHIEWLNGQLWIVVHESKSVAGIRRIPVARELVPWLTRHNGGMLNAADAYVFQTSTGKPPHRNCIGKVVARVAKRAGVACSPHRLRRTLGYDLLNHGGSLMMVSRILGHSSTQVTEAAYAALLDSTLAREFMAASG
jgi:integrase/recombinase XerD